MPKFRVQYRRKHVKTMDVSPTYKTEAEAMADVHNHRLMERCKVVTIVCDSEGEDFPENAGKWLLHRILK